MTIEAVLGYIVGISLVAVAATVYDKWAAKKRPRHRIPERSLWCLAVLGGSAAMWLTMCGIRHKTRHRSFVVGLPLLMLVQAAALVYIIW